jgi:hypothetical protein
VAAAVEVVAVGAVAAGGVERTGEDDPMKTFKTLIPMLALLVSTSALAAPPAGPRTFASAREAADALVTAAGADDTKALVALFGPDGKPLVSSGDAVRDRNDRAHFTALAKEKLDVVVDPKDPKRATVVAGPDAWPFPAPLVEKDGKWAFAVKSGVRELIDRRIGSNELDAIEICVGYVEAQKEYAEEDRNGNGVLEYAQKVISTKGQRDGLVWWNAEGSIGGPVSDLIAKAISDGYRDRTKPFHGYYFRVLKKQGPHARLGALDYVVGGKMIGGFALVAWPASYRVSGVKTFLVNHDGVVFEKDLGPDTAKTASAITRFDPGEGWKALP